MSPNIEIKLVKVYAEDNKDEVTFIGNRLARLVSCADTP